MAQQLPSLDDRGYEEAPVAWHMGCLARMFVLGASVTVYIVTGSMVIPAAILYAYTAYEPLRCAIWLRNADPVIARGRACFWFYSAMAFWNAAASAFASVLVFLVDNRVRGKQPPTDEFAVTMMTLASGMCVSTVLGLIAVVVAWRANVRVWVHPHVRSRCGGEFHLLGQLERRWLDFNYGLFVMATSLTFPFPAIGTCLLIWRAADAPPPNEVGLAESLVLLFFLGVAPFAMIPVWFFTSPRIIAKRLTDCWAPRAPRRGVEPRLADS